MHVFIIKTLTLVISLDDNPFVTFYFNRYFAQCIMRNVGISEKLNFVFVDEVLKANKWLESSTVIGKSDDYSVPDTVKTVGTSIFLDVECWQRSPFQILSNSEMKRFPIVIVDINYNPYEHWNAVFWFIHSMLLVVENQIYWRNSELWGGMQCLVQQRNNTAHLVPIWKGATRYLTLLSPLTHMLSQNAKNWH